MNLSQASAEWLEAKEVERQATERRRKLEDKMLSLIGIPETLDGTQNHEAPGFQIKVTGRMNRKVDGDKLQAIALENGLTDHLATLFRWKPDLNMAVWKATSDNITSVLSEAITTTPGRASFSITEIKE